jgi:hypothetical protein
VWVGNAANVGKRKKVCQVLVGNLKEKIHVWCEWALLLAWRRTTRLLPCILTLLRCTETAFDIRTAKSETKGKKCRTVLSAGWCDRPHGKAKHHVPWDMLFGPHNFTVWRCRIHWAVSSPDFITSEYSLWLDLEIEVCVTRPDLPKNWKSALRREMEHII